MNYPKITNSGVLIPTSLLTEADLAHIKSETTYKDTSISHEIKRLSFSYYSSPAKIKALKAQEIVALWRVEDDILHLPQGFAYLVPASVKLRDERILPKFKPLTWHKVPKYEMRYYQKEAKVALLGNSRGQAVMATGTGKSLTMLNLIKDMGLNTLIICPSSIIAKQLYQLISEHLGKRDVGLFGAGKKEVKKITVGLYQSVTKSPELFKDFEAIIVDENQTIGASSLVAITRHLSHVPYFYSVSATNYRADGKTLEIYAASGDVAYSFNTERAIKEGWLAQPVFTVLKVKSDGPPSDDKNTNYKHHVLKNDDLNEVIIKAAKMMMSKGKSTLILVSEIEHGKLLSEALNLSLANGEDKDSMRYIEELNQGKILGLIGGSKMIGVGVDTVRVDCLIMASFPGSEGLTTQLLGRGLRMYPGKKIVTVIDLWPTGSKMLSRHAESRIRWYRQYGQVTIKETYANS